MKSVLIALLLLLGLHTTAQKKWNYKIGWITPIPFYLQTNYTVDVSSALVQVKYKLNEKFKVNATTGYLRFRPNEPEWDIFSTVPVMVGGSYDVGNSIYVGLNIGPSYFNEYAGNVNPTAMIYSPYIGWFSGHWSVDLQYFNWEEIPDEANSLVLCLSYNF